MIAGIDGNRAGRVRRQAAGVTVTAALDLAPSARGQRRVYGHALTPRYAAAGAELPLRLPGAVSSIGKCSIAAKSPAAAVAPQISE